MLRTLLIAFFIALIIWGCFGFEVRPAVARELPECQLLRDLQESYRGVMLTAEQKAMKVQAASWYRKFCGRRYGIKVRSNN